MTVGIVGSMIETGQEIPPGTENLAAKIPGMVAADIAPGSEIVLEPTNEPSGPFAMRTELTHRGDARYVSTIPAVLSGRVQVVPDIAAFIRGDANDDGVVDISDPQATLNYLFLGGASPDCLDAADANDDGRLDVADPVATLNFLFQGAGSLPPPAGSPGPDETPDDLDCRGHNG
jgi:hypothetical protein